MPAFRPMRRHHATERLILRPWTQADAEEYRALVAERNAGVPTRDVLHAAIGTGRERLWATAWSRNAPSLRVLDKLGMMICGAVITGSVRIRPDLARFRTQPVIMAGGVAGRTRGEPAAVEYQRGHDVDAQLLARRRRVLGDDHPDTLRSALYLALDLRALGEYQQAHDLDADTLARRRRVLGDDHPDTRRSADNLDKALRALGGAAP